VHAQDYPSRYNCALHASSPARLRKNERRLGDYRLGQTVKIVSSANISDYQPSAYGVLIVQVAYITP
jgi:hypothetical protein